MNEISNESSNASFRSGFAAIVGRPNVGKSTLLNAMIGQKVTIVSDKPQTTRNTVRAVWTTGDAQVVFLDTPGLHRPYDRLGRSMNQATYDALAEVDVVLFVVDGWDGVGPGDRKIARRLENVRRPVILVVNKLDQVSDDERAARLDSFRQLNAYTSTHGISAKTGSGVQELLDAVVACMSEGPRYFPDDWVVDHPERFIVAEFIREKALALTREEVPHSIAVIVEAMHDREEKDLVHVEATIYVERPSQKGIVIGHRGERLKEIGTSARHDIEQLLGTNVYLNVWVKVRKNWRENEAMLRSLGYRS